MKISLADESGHCVGLAIWGGKASKLHADLVSNGRGQVIAVKGAKVFRWNEGEGVSLTAWETCAVGLNPDIAQTAALVGWWNERGGSTAALHSVGPPIRYMRQMLVMVKRLMMKQKALTLSNDAVIHRPSQRRGRALWRICSGARRGARRGCGEWRPPC